ncbi:MAG: hypothetical protein QM482_06305 [Sulfurospirillum sp.]
MKYILVICISCTIVLMANEQDMQRVKNSIKIYFKNQNIIFLHIKEMTNKNYFVIIRNNNMQERIETTKHGKILSIIDDLSVVDEAEEGC